MFPKRLFIIPCLAALLIQPLGESTLAQKTLFQLSQLLIEQIVRLMDQGKQACLPLLRVLALQYRVYRSYTVTKGVFFLVGLG